MSWTFDSTSLSTSLSQVRLLIGDTNTNDQLLTDEEVNFFYSERSDIRLAAIECCSAIIGKLSRDIDRSNLGQSATRSQKIQHYKDLMERLRRETSAVAEVFIGGVSVSNRDNLDSEDDFIKPAFSRDRNDYVSAGNGEDDD